jgi:peptidyl-prolyl cis-trans isomerase SDCCAG10
MLTDEDDLKRKDGKSKSKMNATKDFKLLSFGDEAEEDEETMTSSETKFKSKSSHDLLNDPKLSKDVGSEFDTIPVKPAPIDIETVRSKLTKKPEKTLPFKVSGDRISDTKKSSGQKSSSKKEADDIESDVSSEEEDERTRIQKEIKALKKDLRAPKKKDEVKLDEDSSTTKGQKEEEKNDILKAFHEEQVSLTSVPFI